MIKVYIFNPISKIWIHKSNFLTITSNIHNADFLIFEQNGDPISSILYIKKLYSKYFHKLIFILSGDQNHFIDNISSWFSCSTLPNNILCKFQKQIFVTNPTIFRFSNPIHKIDLNKPRNIDIYFKGSIWDGMRKNMKTNLEKYPNVMIEDFSSYWNWRFEKNRTNDEIQDKAFELYHTLLHVKLSLCPKGNGNSSMRIIESIACGAVPVLIDDFSSPYGFDLSSFCLSFDSKKDSWESIYDTCIKFIQNTEKYNSFRQKGIEFYLNIVCCDFNENNYYDYSDLNTILYGSSSFLTSYLLIHFFRQSFYDFSI